MNSNAPLAVRGTRLAIHKTLGLPMHEAELLAESFRERVTPHRGRAERPRAFVEKRAPNWQARLTTTFEDDPCGVDADAHVATITLNRPDALNTFNRLMCHEMRDVWALIKADDRVHARCCAPPVTRRSRPGSMCVRRTGSPRSCGITRSGELLSPSGRRCEAGCGCGAQACTAGALYFINEADVVICSERPPSSTPTSPPDWCAPSNRWA